MARRSGAGGARATEGIVLRHQDMCGSRRGDACDCQPRFQAHAWDPVTQRKVRRTFASRAEAKSWRASATTAIARQELRAVTAPTLAAAAEELLAGMRTGAIRARGGDPFKPATVRAYETSLREHITPVLGRRRLNDISRGDLADLVEMMLGRGSASSTIRNAINPLHLIYRRALDRGIVTVSPTARLPLPAPAPGRDRIATPTEQAALIAALRSPADETLWTLALGAGLRAGELQALRWEDVDLEEGLIHVRRSFDPKSKVFIDPKSKRSRRSVPMLGGVRAALLAHRLGSGRRSGLVFGRDGERTFTHSSALQRATRDWRAAGVPPLACDLDAASRGEAELPAFGRIGLHEARHTYCSMLLDAGISVASVSRYAGHASPAFTLARYVHPRADQASDDAAKADAYLALASRSGRS